MSYSTSSPRLQVSSVEPEVLSYPQHDLLPKLSSNRPCGLLDCLHREQDPFIVPPCHSRAKKCFTTIFSSKVKSSTGILMLKVI